MQISNPGMGRRGLAGRGRLDRVGRSRTGIALCLAAMLLLLAPGAWAEVGGQEPARITIKNWSPGTYTAALRIDDRRYPPRMTVESETWDTWIVNPSTCPQTKSGEIRIKREGTSNDNMETVVEFDIKWIDFGGDCRTIFDVKESADFIEIAEQVEKIELTIKKR